MASRTRHGRCERTRALLLAATLGLAPGCAGWNPFAPDPMQEELRRLERERSRTALEEQTVVRTDVDLEDREEAPKTVEERLRLGDRHLAAGRITSAVWEYATAHRMDPRSAEPRVRLGYVHLRLDPERAQPLFESALEREPDHVSAHIGLGLSLFDSGRREAGLRHLERAVELAPRSAKARQALGVSLDQLGRHAEALTQLEAARALQPHDSRILNNLGVAYLRSGLPERAEELLRAALRHDDRDGSLRNTNLGMALAMQGRFDEALEAFRRAGDEQSARSNLGYAYYLRGDYDRAIEEYERALVVGGEASVQVLRNLKAARHAQRVGRRPPGEAPGVPPNADTAPDAAEVVREETPEAGEEGKGPAWVFKESASPTDLAE